MHRLKIGEYACCKICAQDIEWHGISGWRDRGGNRECVPYKARDGEIVRPLKGTKHKPIIQRETT